MTELRALVVDDDELSRDLLIAMLQRLGLSASTAASGTEGLNALGRDTYDLLLLDLRLPDMDGVEVIKRHRETGGSPAIKVLFISGADTCETEERCREVGCDGFLSKPFSYQEFARLMSRMFGS